MQGIGHVVAFSLLADMPELGNIAVNKPLL